MKFVFKKIKFQSFSSSGRSYNELRRDFDPRADEGFRSLRRIEIGREKSNQSKREM